FKCGICGAHDASLIYHFDFADVVLCKGCGTAQTLKLVPESASYEEGYFTGKLPGMGVDYTGLREIFLADNRKRLKEIEKRKRGGRKILEIGCATGYFLEVCRERGWDAYGVEPSRFASARARERGLNVFCGELKDANLKRESFDVVTLWHVLEHLRDPLGTLVSVGNLLKKDGLLVLTVPDFGSGRSKKMKEKWPHLEPAMHLYHFTRSNLGDILKKAGFEAVDYSLSGGTGITAENRPERTKRLAKFMVWHLAYFQWLRSAIGFLRLRVLRRHDFITVYARKQTVDVKLTVSIVTGKSGENLENCLASLKASAGKYGLKLAIVDNQSGFNPEAIARKYFSGCEIVRNDAKKGFAANHNQVLKDLNTEYALVLNDDVEIGRGSLDTLIDFADNHKDGAIFGPLLYPGDWQAAPHRSGGCPDSVIPVPLKVCIFHILSELGLGGTLKNLMVYKVSGEEFLALSFVSGACSLIRKSALDTFGYYDENFYMYFEDIDLGMRANKAGWRCYQVNNSKVLHKGGSSFSFGSWPWISAGAVYFAKKHHSFFTVLLTELLVLVLNLTAGAKRFLTGKWIKK
ncbi:MAG: methyltransferase domain-containing protein, partial [Candidatus Omnitrophica bacterium]|nr:methyltransferase domain-containing protein [Candidatus Omnitrophota bacterium]